jgi:hypothetical protein
MYYNIIFPFRKYLVNKDYTMFSSDEDLNSDSDDSDCDNASIPYGSRSPVLNPRELAYRAARQRLLAQRDDDL